MFPSLPARAVRLAGTFVTCMMLAVAAPALAQSPIKQIKLTDTQVQGFIAAQKPMAAIIEKMEGAATDKPDPKTQAQLETAAKASGFKDFAEYDEVASNIAMVMAGIDPQSKQFTEPQIAIKREITDIEADKTITAPEKKQMIEELNEALKNTAPIQFPENVALVTKYYEKIDAVLE